MIASMTWERLRLLMGLLAAATAGGGMTLAGRGTASAEGAPSPRPEPIVKTNCVRCHLKAGRDLTEAVHTFAQSRHDFEELSCNDCHGGNTEVDADAHSRKFGFLGTKMSAHLGKCRECHEEPASVLAKGPHFWDHDQRLNPEFPLCVDCHGNHDVGNPPAEFSLTLVCQDCHEDYRQKFPAYAAVTDENDALWTDLRAYRAKHPGGPAAMPEDLAEALAEVRSATSTVIHGAHALDAKAAETLHRKVASLRKKLRAAGNASEPEEKGEEKP